MDNNKNNFNINYDNIPGELKAMKRWVGVRITAKPDGSGYDKALLRVSNGHNASSTQSYSWTTFEAARRAVAEGRFGFNGIAFSFQGSGLVGIDLDHCADGQGNVSDFAKSVLAKVQSYAEFSPSGKGIHIVAKCGGDIPCLKTAEIEIYQTARFFTVTGNLVPGATREITDRTEEVIALRSEFDKPQIKVSEQSNAVPRMYDKATTDRISAIRNLKPPDTGGALPDGEILSLALNQQNDGLRAKFTALWNGDTAEQGGDKSKADYALCRFLAYWTRNDAAQIDRLFRQSGLCNTVERMKKWDEKHHNDGSSYGVKTIQRAIAATKKVRPTGAALNSGEKKSKRKSGGGEASIVEIDGAYHIAQSDGRTKRLTNFTIALERKLITEDGALYSVKLIGAESGTACLHLRPGDFISVQSFKKRLAERDISWSYLGADKDLELIKEYLISKPCPESIGFKGIGMKNVPTDEAPERWVYVGESCSIDGGGNAVPEAEHVAHENPIRSAIESNDEISAYELQQAGRALLGYNDLTRTASVLCFMAGCFAKAKLMSRGVKFPHLVICGESGSGKSHTVENVIFPFYSMKECTGASKLSRYSLMSACGASNCIPFVINEFKPSTLKDTMREAVNDTMRDLYDGHFGARGQSDMSVKRFRLTTPAILIGEESLSETATTERNIELLFSKQDIEYRKAEGKLLTAPRMHDIVRQFGKAVLLTALNESASALKQKHGEYVSEADAGFADRIRDNVAAVLVGRYILEKTAVRYGLSFKDAFGVSTERVAKAVNDAVRIHTLHGGTYNRSVVDKTFGVFDRMTDILKEGVHYKAIECPNKANSAIAFAVYKCYDLYMRYRRDHGIKGEAPSAEVFCAQLEQKDYFVKKNHSVSLREPDNRDGTPGKHHTVKCCLLNAKRLAECAEIPNILERCGITVPDEGSGVQMKPCGLTPVARKEEEALPFDD
jgi:primase-polymerase (primpol)-like protein